MPSPFHVLVWGLCYPWSTVYSVHQSDAWNKSHMTMQAQAIKLMTLCVHAHTLGYINLFVFLIHAHQKYVTSCINCRIGDTDPIHICPDPFSPFA